MASPLARLVRSLDRDRSRLLGAGRWHGLLVASIGLFAVLAMPSSASAHGADESKEGYVLVQQALGYLAEDSGQAGIDLAMEKVDDALAAEDQDGVAVADVTKAKSALEGGRVEQARTLLQGSIKEALSALEPAMGEETGTTVVTPALPGREGLTGRDWGFLVASVVLLLAGIGLAFRFRPHDTVGELRRRLGASNAAVVGAGNPTRVERDL